MTDFNQEESPGKDKTRKIEIDPKFSNSLQGGLDALQQVFSTVVSSIKEAIGPETLKNLELAQWLENLAACIEQVSNSLKDAGTVPADKRGEIEFYLDQLEGMLRSSKFANNLEAFNKRAQIIQSAMQQASSENAVDNAAKLSEVAGYFRAAAKSITPLQSPSA